jgi:hypothetical protein
MTPKAYIPTRSGVYEFDATDIRALSVTMENPRDRFVPLHEHGETYTALLIKLTAITDNEKPPSLWAVLKNWWRMRRYVKGIRIDPRRG